MLGLDRGFLKAALSRSDPSPRGRDYSGPSELCIAPTASLATGLIICTVTCKFHVCCTALHATYEPCRPCACGPEMQGVEYASVATYELWALDSRKVRHSFYLQERIDLKLLFTLK